MSCPGAADARTGSVEGMIAGLHCHYPMHLLANDPSPSDTYDRIVHVRRRPRWQDRLRALVVRIAAREFNYRDHASGWRVTFDGLERSHTGLVCSVLFEPFAEIDLDELPQAAPEDGYFADLVEHLDRVEAELKRIDPPRARHLVVRSAADLEDAQETGRMAFVHCVEGGFHLGRTPESITANVEELARRRLRDARAPLLPPHSHQRAGAADALRRAVQPHPLPAARRGPDRARGGRRACDVQAPCPHRCQPHACGGHCATPSTCSTASTRKAAPTRHTSR